MIIINFWICLFFICFYLDHNIKYQVKKKTVAIDVSALEEEEL